MNVFMAGLGPYSKIILFFSFFMLNLSSSFSKDNARGPTPSHFSLTRDADNCGPIDRRAQLPPVRDQGSLGWCYAYTAADLISYELDLNISPVDIALSYNREVNIDAFRTSWNQTRGWLNRLMLMNNGDAPSKGARPLVKILNHLVLSYSPESMRDAGWTSRAIEAAQLRGFCAEEDLTLAGQEETDLVHVISQYRGLFTSYLEYVEENGESTLPEYICSLNKNPYASLVETLGLDIISDAIENRFDQDLFLELAHNLCENRHDRIFTPINERLHEASTAQKIERIDQVLDSGSILGIAYNVEMLTHSPGEYHASSVVGRRFNPASLQCEYLVRNSWGEACNYQHYDCEDGHIWVNQERLSAFVDQIDYIPRQEE
jgi:hypothetical protein